MPLLPPLELPIKEHAETLYEWLRTGKASIDGNTVVAGLPKVDQRPDKLAFRWDTLSAVISHPPFRATVSANVTVEICDDGQHPDIATLFSMLRKGKIRLAPAVDLVVPDPFGFTVTPFGEAARLAWQPRKRPWLDTPLPDFIDGVVMAIDIYEDHGRIQLKNLPDVRLNYV